MTLEHRVADQDRFESVRPGDGETVSTGRGVSLREFVSKACGTMGFSTGMATFDSGNPAVAMAKQSGAAV
jgi:hypothetical protein